MNELKVTQTEYESLLEERSAFSQAGMEAKVAEWDFKIKSLEVTQKYEKIDFNHIASEFGIDGLNQALASRDMEQEEEAKKYCADLLKKSRLSETALYTFLDNSEWQWGRDKNMTARIIRLLAPKLASKTARATFQMMYKIEEMNPVRNREEAFIKVDRIADYQQNDNPPMMELMKTIEANNSGVFDAIYIAYPMIGKVKNIDPITFGVLKDPTKSYNELNDFTREISTWRIDSVNFGDMYKINQWF